MVLITASMVSEKFLPRTLFGCIFNFFACQPKIFWTAKAISKDKRRVRVQAGARLKDVNNDPRGGLQGELPDGGTLRGCR